MPPKADLVMERAVFKQYPAEDSRVHQQFQGAEYRSSSQARQQLAQFFGGEVTVLVRHHLATARRGSVVR